MPATTASPDWADRFLWRPTKNLHFNFNDYGLGEDDAGFPGRSGVHADYSMQWKMYDNPKQHSLTSLPGHSPRDFGCEYGGGPVSFATPNGAEGARRAFRR
jgi:hypothetical protein